VAINEIKKPFFEYDQILNNNMQINYFYLKLIFTALSIFAISYLNAQVDAHYWTHLYGGKALLLNGAVIASTDDETAVFYNPAALGIRNEEDFSISLSFLTPAYSVLKTQNYLGEGNTVKDTDFGFTPGLAAAGFSPFGSQRFRMALTSFTRFKSNIRFRGRGLSTVSDNDNLLFVGNFEFERRLSQRWLGIGFAYNITNTFSIGMSQFATFHSENTLLRFQKEIVEKSSPETLLLGWRNQVKYSFSVNGAMVTKVGLSLRMDRLKLGLTYTSPSYGSLWNNASYEFDDLKFFTQDSTTLISNFSDATVLDYKTPMSIGFGIEVPIQRSIVAIALEFFKQVETHTVFEDRDDPFDGLAPGAEEQEIRITNGNRAVLNFALGGQTELNERSTLHWGFRTDFNQRRIFDNFETLQFLSTTPNVYHLSVGNSIEIWNSKFSFGIDYGFGVKKGANRLVDFSNVTPDNLFQLTDEGQVTSRFQSIVFILAYDFNVN